MENLFSFKTADWLIVSKLVATSVPRYISALVLVHTDECCFTSFSLLQEYNFAEVRDREYLLTLHKQANKASLDLLKYNRLRDAISQTEYDLQRLRDPLQMNLPVQSVIPSHLSKEPHPVFDKEK